jgi:hypothetical protein
VKTRLDNPVTQATLGTRQRTRKTNNTTQNTKSISNMGDQNPYITEGQTKQWSKEKGQKDKQQSTKHYTEN